MVKIISEVRPGVTICKVIVTYQGTHQSRFTGPKREAPQFQGIKARYEYSYSVESKGEDKKLA